MLELVCIIQSLLLAKSLHNAHQALFMLTHSATKKPCARAGQCFKSLGSGQQLIYQQAFDSILVDALRSVTIGNQLVILIQNCVFNEDGYNRE